MRLNSVIAGGLMLMASATVASAAVITVTASYPPTNLPLLGTTTSLSVAKFDTSLGTLLSVDVVLDGFVFGTFSGQRFGATGDVGPVVFNSILGNDYTLEVNSMTLFTLDVETAVTVTVPRVTTVTQTIASPGVSNSANVNLVAPAMLTYFSGPGTAAFTLGIVRENGPTTFVGNAGSRQTRFGNGAQADLEVRYNYREIEPPVPVPEPMMLSLFGMSLLGLGLVGRRRART